MSVSFILLYCTVIFTLIARECVCDWQEEESGKLGFCLR